jgi:hypothetical protein
MAKRTCIDYCKTTHPVQQSGESTTASTTELLFDEYVLQAFCAYVSVIKESVKYIVHLSSYRNQQTCLQNCGVDRGEIRAQFNPHEFICKTHFEGSCEI